MNRKQKIIYTACLLVLLIGTYYYFSRIYEGLDNASKTVTSKPTPAKPSTKPTTTTTQGPPVAKLSTPIGPPPIKSTPIGPPVAKPSMPVAPPSPPIKTTPIQQQQQKPPTNVKASNEVRSAPPTETTQVSALSNAQSLENKYLQFYQTLTEADKKQMKKTYNHFIENVIKDDFL